MFEIGGLLFIYVASALWLNYNMIKEKTIKIPSYLTSFTFITLSFPLVNLQNAWNIALSLLFLICIYVEIIGVQNASNPKRKVFKTGFLLGCLILLDRSFCGFYPIILISLIYYQQFNWRHFIIQLLGLSYPLSLCYVLYSTVILPFKDLVLVDIYADFYRDPQWFFVIFILLIISLKELHYNYNKKTEKSKKAFNLLFVILMIIALQALLLSSMKFIHLFALPIAIIIANYLIYIRYKKFRTFLLGLLLVTFVLKFLCP